MNRFPSRRGFLSLEGIKLELEIERIQTSRLVRTPNGIRTRAATLKGWWYFLTGRRKSTDQLVFLMTSFLLLLVAGTPRALRTRSSQVKESTNLGGRPILGVRRRMHDQFIANARLW